MPTSAPTFYNSFFNKLAKGAFNFDTDTISVALTNAAPNVSTHDELADITEIATGGGYTQGTGIALTDTLTQVGASTTWTANDHTLTATGGSIGPFRYVVLFDQTASGDPLICYWDYGSSLTLASGESLLIDFPAVIITFAVAA